MTTGKTRFYFYLQGFTYVAPSVLEEMARPSVVKARSPRKPYTPNSAGPFSPRVGLQNPFTFANGADSMATGQYEQMDTSNCVHTISQNQHIQTGHNHPTQRPPPHQSTFNWKH